MNEFEKVLNSKEFKTIRKYIKPQFYFEEGVSSKDDIVEVLVDHIMNNYSEDEITD